MKNKSDTFVLRIVNNQHATWQGTITWLEKNEVQSFRSALELLKMIDTAISTETPAEEEAAHPTV